MPAARESIDVDFEDGEIELSLTDADILVDTPPPLPVVPSLPPRAASDDVPLAAAVLAPPEAPKRAPAASTTMRPPPTVAALTMSSRLPPVSPPPLARKPSPAKAEQVADASDTLETLPLPMKSPFEATADGRVVLASTGPVGGSVAPLTISRNEETVVVFRRRERGASRRPLWALAGAAVVLVAATAAHFALRTTPAPAAAAAPPPAEVPSLDPTPVVAPVVVTFAEGDAVVIDAPATSSAPRAADKIAPPPAAEAHVVHPPVASGRLRNPSVYAPVPMPDGSLGLASKGPVSSPAAAPGRVPLPPPPARKKPLTPEQELAEAQLRAAAR
ncbi:MAG TPA: hypothetical protein VM925_35875 [Labilithrix sp.]|nr:hypothetical protein [Labilithrix sp.]